jgi:Peptidase A4 family
LHFQLEIIMSTQSHACGKRLAGITLAATFLMAVAHPYTPAAFKASDIAHAPIAVHRNDDGSLKRARRNQIETSNWSGYAVANFESNALYTAAQGSWIVAAVSYQQPPGVCRHRRFERRFVETCFAASASAEYSASWVGIGGYCTNTNCTQVDNSLIQLGTAQNVSADGTTQYFAWIEMLPESESELSPSAYPVEPGDTITASLSCQSACTPGDAQSWLLTMTDATKDGTKWTFATTVSYKSSLLSAEWIEEAPSSSAGILPLADYGTTTFFGASVNGDSSPALVGTDAILMVDPYGETSNPSSTTFGDEFSTCWGDNPSSIATCAEPQLME